MLRTSLALALFALPVQADEFAPALQAFLQDQVATWADDDALVAAIRAQNVQTAGLTEARILEMDAAWRNEVGAADQPTIQTVLSSPAAEVLRGHMTDSGGAITEAFIMDAVGLNVAATDVTSDYWQGDEDKHQKTYGMGAGAFHVSEVEFDESTQTYQGQVSMTIVDPATGEAIGAITVGVNAEYLM